MKRIVILFTVLLIVFSFVSCGGNKVSVNNPTEGFDSSSEVYSDTQLFETTVPQFVQSGYPVTLGVRNNDNSAQYFKISFPTDTGREILYGQGSAALDGTWVLCGGSILDETIECDSVENIYEAFSGRWVESIDYMRGDSAYSDFNFIAEKREMTEINGFTMCRYEGTHTYNYTDFSTGEVTPKSCYFVAYGTQFSAGAYVYWIVFDDSEDQSLKDVVNLNAENMAKSLEETTLF